MIICPECGTRNEEGEQFCGGCGTYLEWADQPAAAADEGAGELEALAEPDAAPDPTPAPTPVSEPAPEPSPVNAAAVPVSEPVAEPVGLAAVPPLPSLPPTDVEPVPTPVAAALADHATLADRAGDGVVHPRVVTQPTPPEAAATGPEVPPQPWEPPPGTPPPPPTDPFAPEPLGTNGVSTAPVDRPVPPRVRPAQDSAAAASVTAPPAAPPAAAPVRPTTPTPPPATPDAKIAAAAALVAPPQKPAPAVKAPARQPAAVKPGAPKPPPAPRKVAADEPPPAPGDLICGSCGAGNTPSRKFCRRCGTSLLDAKVQPQRSRWSRFWRPEPKRGPAAGYRPRRRRRFPTRPLVAVLVLGALVTAAFSFRPEIDRARITVLDRVQGNVAVNPTAEVASSQAAGHEVGFIRDGTTNLYWAPADPGDGVGQFVDFTFAQPFRLTRILVTPGASDVEKDYLASASPQVLTLTATTAAGTQQSVDVPLADRVGLQNASLGIDDVVALRLTITSTYRATPQTHVAIAEVEFRGRT